MRAIILLLSVLLLAMWCPEETFSPIGSKSNVMLYGPVITIDSLVINYGNISNKENYRNEIRFTNTGNEPLIIASCKSSCGCLVASCTKEPVLPNESSQIEFHFYTLNRNGPFSKSISLTSNALNNPVVIQIKGIVVD